MMFDPEGDYFTLNTTKVQLIQHRRNRYEQRSTTLNTTKVQLIRKGKRRQRKRVSTLNTTKVQLILS